MRMWDADHASFENVLPSASANHHHGHGRLFAIQSAQPHLENGGINRPRLPVSMGSLY